MTVCDHENSLAGSLTRHLGLGAISLAVLLGGGLWWAAGTDLSGAVIAVGSVAVEGSVKKIQHPTGGIVAELLVTEGQLVAAGDVLIRLDSTMQKVGEAIVSKSLSQALARQAGLGAERDDASELVTPATLITRLGADDAQILMASELRLFQDRRSSREGQKKQLRERVQQLNETIAGHDIQQKTKTEEIELIDQEYQAVKKLFDKGMMTIDRVNALARGIARLRGERGQLIASIAEARGKIAETQLQRLQIDQSFRSDVSLELRELEAKQGELVERDIAANDQLKRITITAPIAGRVQQLTVHTIGGVISPAESLMQIVPMDDELLVEARISAQDIDQVSLEQDAVLRLSAFNRSTTPELKGQVVRLSADLVQDERTGMGFYRAGIKIPRSELTQLQGLTLVPGMPVESMIQTGDAQRHLLSA